MNDPGGGATYVPLFELETIDATDLLPSGNQWECEPCATVFVSARRSPGCPYCALPLVAREGGESDLAFLPESVLPFKVLFGEASAAFEAWVKDKAGLMTPSDFVETAKAESMVGVYLPFFLFRCSTTSDYEVVAVSKGGTSEQPTYTRSALIVGTLDHEFVDLLVCANTALPAGNISALEPWGLDDLQPCQAGLLGDYTIETRGDPEALYEQAKQLMTPVLEECIRMKVGGHYLEVKKHEVECKDTVVRSFLFPLWIVSYRYEETVYRVLINARTGEVSGNHPGSLLKLALLVLGSVGGVCAIIAIALFFAQP